MEPILKTKHITWNVDLLEGDYSSINPHIARLDKLYSKYYQGKDNILIQQEINGQEKRIRFMMPGYIPYTYRDDKYNMSVQKYIERVGDGILLMISHLDYKYNDHPLLTDSKNRIEYTRTICYDETDYNNESMIKLDAPYIKSVKQMEQVLHKLDLLEIEKYYKIQVVLNDNSQYEPYLSEYGNYVNLSILSNEEKEQRGIFYKTNDIAVDLTRFITDAQYMDEILSQLFEKGNRLIETLKAYEPIKAKIELNNHLQTTLKENESVIKPKL